MPGRRVSEGTRAGMNRQLGGVEFRLTQHLLITPNAVITYFDRNDQGIRPETDLHLRVRLFLDLE